MVPDSSHMQLNLKNSPNDFTLTSFKLDSACLLIPVYSLIRIYCYFQEEQSTSGHRLYLCAGLALLAAIVFGMLSSILDQPRDRRMGNE